MSRASEMVYPNTETDRHDAVRGLTIREHFAAMAMQGLLSTGLPGYTDKLATLFTARRSVEYADALLAELAKPVTP